MKKFFLTSSIIYAILLLISLIFLFNNFTKSAEINFIFRIISICLMCYAATYPLLIAAASQLENKIFIRVALYFLFLIVSGGILFLGYKTFGDKNFMFNINLSEDAFVNSQRNLTSVLWIFLVACSVSSIVIFSIKMWRRWPDWTYLLLVPFLPVITALGGAVLSIAIGGLVLYGVLILIGGFFEAFSSSSSTSSNSNYDDISLNDCDEDEEDEEEKEEKEEKRDSIYRTPGECFYDGKGIYRSPGENYYDGNGIYRSPGENYYDGNGIYRSPDENFYDGGN